MTELAIIAAAFLIPLFLLIPLLGKHIDIKHSTLQSARYEVWEYTVWYSGDGEKPRGFDAATQPVKSPGATQNEARRRFFSRTDLPITSGDSSGWEEADRNPLWQTHVGLSLYDGDVGDHSSMSPDRPTPDLLGIFGGIVGAIGAVFDLLARIADFLGLDVGFTAINTDGYFHTRVGVDTEPVRGYLSDEELFPGTTVTATAGVLADGWNAGGRPHAAFQVGGLVPTRALGQLVDMTPFREIWGLVSLVAPELRLCDPFVPLYSGDGGSLWLGHIDFDTVHPDRLRDEDGDPVGTHKCDDGGFCDFDPIPERVPKVLGGGRNICGYVPP